MLLKDRGQTLRFYKADRVRVSADLIRELLTEELWRETPTWDSNFGPGGKRYAFYISEDTASVQADMSSQ